MRRQAALLLSVVMLAATLLAADPPQAAAKTVEEAKCLPGTSQAHALLGYKEHAESFTARHSGKLTKGFVETWNKLSQTAIYTVEIWRADSFGVPTGISPLASTTVTNDHSGYEFEYPTFSSPATVKAGKNYAVVVTVPDASNNGVTVEPGNLCASTFSLNQNGTGAFTADSASRDMWFSVSVAIKKK